MNSDMSLLSSLASQRDLVDMDMANVDLVQLMQINNGGHLMGTLETVAGGDPDMAELLTRLNGLDRGASESERFIDRLVTGAEEADFTMEQVFRLCDIEPEHCEEVFMALEHSVAEKSKPLIIKTCVHVKMKTSSCFILFCYADSYGSFVTIFMILFNDVYDLNQQSHNNNNDNGYSYLL